MRDIILYIGSIFLPDKSAGAQRALSLSKSFRDLGYKTVIVGMSAEQDPKESILDTKSKCMGFDSFSVPQPKNLPQWFHHTVSIKEFKTIVDYYGADRIFAIIAMEYEAIPLWRLSGYCKKKGIYLIADAEEWYEKSNFSFPMNIAKDFDTNLRMKYVYPKKIDHMICISRFFENHYCGIIDNLLYVPGTIDKSEEKWKVLSVYCPNDILTIGYAGHPGITFGKERLDLLIRAVIELNAEGHRCCLKIAGIDNAFISKRLPEVKLDNNIECLGKLSHLQCLNMIALSDFSAIIREDKRVTRAGFPTKLSESFGCGTPVIATKSSNIFEYIEDGKNGVRCYGYTKEDIKQSILRAMSLTHEELQKIHYTLKCNNPLEYTLFTKDIRSFFERIKK